MQIFDNTNGPFVEVYATPSTANGGKGLYATTDALDGTLTKYYLSTTFDVDTAYTLKVTILNGVLNFYYNGSLVATESGVNRDALYFKAGDYCQSWQTIDSLSDYCETEITAIAFSHI
jgi:hypothetical protein